MGGYLVNFAVYTMAMIGLIFFALMVYKKCTEYGGLTLSKNKSIEVEEAVSLAPRKTLYIVRVGQERFLLAGDADKTTLIAKLNNSETVQNILTQEIFTKTNKPTKINDSNKANNPVTIDNHSLIDDISENTDNTADWQDITPEQIADVRKNSGKLSKPLNSSVDDIPVIVDFPKNKKDNNEDVLHSMLKKISK